MRPGRESNPKKQFKVCRFNRLNYRGCCSSFRAVISRFQIAQNLSSATRFFAPYIQPNGYKTKYI